MTRLALLGLLAAAPAHGYRLKQRWDEHLGTVWPVNIGRVYEQLAALRTDGLVEHAPEGATLPPRGRRALLLTARGAETLGAWLGTSTYRPRPVRDDVLLRLAVMLEMGATDVSPVLRREGDAARQHRQRLEERARATTAPLRRLAIDAEVLQTEAYLRWLEQCALVFEQMPRPPRDA